MEERSTKHPLDVHREVYLGIARAVCGDDDDDARDQVAHLLETRDHVCARDALRIASAWIRKRETPTNYRLK